MNKNLNSIPITRIVKVLNKGGVVIYPTEAVFSIGCDPDKEIAVNKLLNIKQRPIEKGLILIASDYHQLRPYIDDSILTQAQRNIVFSIWPGPVTFVFPKKISTPYWLTGNFNSLAVRVTNHPIASKLCQIFGKPLISTSANLSGKPPCRTIKEIILQFGEDVPILEGETGKRENTSEIHDICTGKRFR